MAFSDRFINSEEEKENISEYLGKIYSDLLTLYTRADDKEFDISIHYMDYPTPIKKTIHVLHSNFNIPIRILEEDFKWLERYLEATEFPTIESHLVRVSLEFGAWVVFFRSKTEEILRPKVQKVLQIWRGLFVDSSSEPDDMLYLLIELENLSQNIGQPILDLWLSQYEYKPSVNQTELLMALILNATVRLGEDLVDGAIRKLENRLREMELEEILEERNTLINDAEAFRQFLLREIRKHKENVDSKFSGAVDKRFFATLVLVGLIERFMKNEKQTEQIYREDAVLNFIKLVRSEELESSMDKILEAFEQTMFESNISDPLFLLELIVKKILEESSQTRIEDVISELRDLIEEEKAHIMDAGEQNPEMALILAVQEAFPLIMKKIVHIEASSAMEKMVEKGEKATQLILIFTDKLIKFKRKSHNDLKEEEIKTAVASLYNNAIINGIPIDLFSENLQKSLKDEFGITFKEFDPTLNRDIIEFISQSLINWLKPQEIGSEGDEEKEQSEEASGHEEKIFQSKEEENQEEPELQKMTSAESEKHSHEMQNDNGDGG
ncbi:MAG: hypothetical protein D6732_14655 [Methanobacteriota archaeon]|nr:MAG: hypothetical protein D6732_14655 [Euryarchaeota archaeon]